MEIVIFKFISSLVGIALICLVIAGMAIISGIRFLSKTRPIFKALEHAIKSIEKHEDEDSFALNLDEFEDEMGKNQYLKDAWREFRETIIPAQEKGQKVRNVHESADFFNEKSCLFNHIDIEHYHSFPNYLTGSGILGTFLGLVAGIYLAHGGLVSGSPVEANNSLAQLLNGASLAFASSLVGLSFSIVYSLLSTRRTYKLKDKITKFSELLDERMERISIEHISNEALNEVREQTNQLKLFNTDLATSIGDAIEKKMSPTWDRLTETLSELRMTKESQTQDMLNNVVEHFHKTLSGNTGVEMRAIADTLNTIHTNLGGFSAMMTDGIQYLSQAAESAGESLKRTLETSTVRMQEQMDASLGRILETFSSASGRLNEGIVSASEEAAGHIRTAVTDFGENLSHLDGSVQSMNSAIEGITSALSNLGRTVEAFSIQSETITQLSTKLSNSTKSLEGALERTNTLMDGATELTLRLESMAEEVSKQSRHMQEAWDQQRGRFESLDGELRNAFSEINEGLHAYTEKVREFHAGMDKHVSKAIQDLGGAINELQGVLDDIHERGIGVS